MTRAGERLYLQHVRAGGKIFTTEQWLKEFFIAVAEADSQHFAATTDRRDTLTKPRTPDQRRKAVAAAEAALKKDGI